MRYHANTVKLMPLQRPARFIPLDWINPIDLAAVFGASPRRLEVDVGAGKGRFILARAAANPAASFLGIERILKRVEQTARKAESLGLENFHILYCDAAYAVRYLLPSSSVSVFHVYFSDPWPKRRHHARRLFSPEFAHAMVQALASGGRINAATDHAGYFNEIRNILSSLPGLVEIESGVPPESEQTDYELEFLLEQRTINRCAFELQPG